MSDIIKNAIDGKLAEQVARAELESQGFMVLPSKRIGFDNVSILLDSQGRIEQLYVCEVKYVNSKTKQSHTRLSKTQARLRNLCRKTRIDHLTYHVNDYQIREFLTKSIIDDAGGAI